MSKVDDVQRAIEAVYENPHIHDDWLRAMAIAAIEAMREPTLPMCGAACDCADCIGDMWRAMIDEALK